MSQWPPDPYYRTLDSLTNQQFRYWGRWKCCSCKAHYMAYFHSAFTSLFGLAWIFLPITMIMRDQGKHLLTIFHVSEYSRRDSLPVFVTTVSVIPLLGLFGGPILTWASAIQATYIANSLSKKQVCTIPSLLVKTSLRIPQLTMAFFCIVPILAVIVELFNTRWDIFWSQSSDYMGAIVGIIAICGIYTGIVDGVNDYVTLLLSRTRGHRNAALNNLYTIYDY